MPKQIKTCTTDMIAIGGIERFNKVCKTCNKKIKIHNLSTGKESTIYCKEYSARFLGVNGLGDNQ